MMDINTTEEMMPLPLPVDKQFSNAYINSNFKDRNQAQKSKLLIYGQVKILSKDDRKGV
jgi:hypothetical protein